MLPKREVIVPIGPSIAYVQLTKNKYSLIDSEDAAKVSLKNWRAVLSWKRFYAVSTKRLNGKQMAFPLHRYLINKDIEGMVVDHINSNSLDNRKCNLRPATHTQNMRNRRSSNPSGYKGISWQWDKWQASISVNNKSIYLGRFTTKEEAHAAYVGASSKFHGEFGRPE